MEPIASTMTHLSNAFIPFRQQGSAETTHTVRSDLAKETVEALFGPPGEVGATLPDDGFASLLERVLAIEACGAHERRPPWAAGRSLSRPASTRAPPYLTICRRELTS
jgi:hypothetical protein